MDLKGIAVTAVIMAVVGQIVHTVESLLTMGYYTDPSYLQVWSKLMMPSLGSPPPTSFFIYSFVFSLVMWALFGFAYSKLGSALKHKLWYMKGLKFGALMFLVSGVQMTLLLYLMINLPVAVISSWMVTSLMLNLIGGAVAAKFITE